jgi:hypothetical protein
MLGAARSTALPDWILQSVDHTYFWMRYRSTECLQ